MREVNNNTTNSANLSFQCIKPMKDVQTNGENFEEVTDLGKMPADVIGRSQVTRPAIEEDLAFLNEHPEMVKDANKMFDYLVDVEKMPYEEAALVVEAATKEFTK